MQCYQKTIVAGFDGRASLGGVYGDGTNDRTAYTCHPCLHSQRKQKGQFSHTALRLCHIKASVIFKRLEVPKYQRNVIQLLKYGHFCKPPSYLKVTSKGL